MFEKIKGLKEKNVTVIYISHRLDEIFELGDYVTVMRDGKHIDTRSLPEVKDRAELIKMMIGKAVYEEYVPCDLEKAESLLKVNNLCNKKLQEISFDVKRGEVVGFYGLVGAGKTDRPSQRGKFMGYADLSFDRGANVRIFGNFF